MPDRDAARRKRKAGLARRNRFQNHDFIVQRLHLADTHIHGKAGVRALVKKPPFTAHKHTLIGQAHGNKSIVFFSDNAVPPDLVALLAEEKQLPVARAEALHLPHGIQ